MDYKKGDQVVWYRGGNTGKAMRYVKTLAVVEKTPKKDSKRVTLTATINGLKITRHIGRENIEFPKEMKHIDKLQMNLDTLVITH